MRRVYISGPMTGMPDHNFPAFCAEAVRLRALGYDVVNPVEINPEPGVSWQDCLRKDLLELLTCDTLALMPGWQRSQGAHLEMHVAHRVGIEIVIASEIQARLDVPVICPNCEEALPDGCEGLFADDGPSCWRNRAAVQGASA